MGSTILLVDDNKMFIDIQREFLAFSNVEVLQASDGLAALDVIRSKRPDLIFMDLQMPKMDGTECCRAIKSDPALAGIPVVMVTSKDNGEVVDLCYSAGCNDFLSKPVDMDTFLEVTHKFIPGIDRWEGRKSVSIKALLRVNAQNIPCNLINLSIDGAFIATDYPGSPKGAVQVVFTLPDGSEIDCDGRIVWINRIMGKCPPGIGIKFALIPPQMFRALTNFINTHT
jgi:CheY-like chemotaxis protein